MISKLPVPTLQDQDWVDAIIQGLAVWNDQDEDADAADEVNSSDEEDEEGDDDAEGETE
jgi:hypothetical protein